MEFSYPIFMEYIPQRDTEGPFVVEFTDISKGVVIQSENDDRPIGYHSKEWVCHTKVGVWKEVTIINPYLLEDSLFEVE